MTRMSVGAVLRLKLPADPQPVYWVGEVPAQCDLCRKKIDGSFADARTQTGAWASLDLGCLRVHGMGTGAGKGQVYRRQPDGRWLKIDG